MGFSRSIVIAALAVGLACSDGNAPPVPTGVVALGGSGQLGYPGDTLALPLRVRVTGAGGAAYPGVRVNWVVSVGSASLVPSVDTTDVNGEASTTVAVGVIPGNLVVNAVVTGVTPVPFTLTTLDPCDVLVPLSTDTVHTGGVLTNFDCQFNGPFFTDFYSLSLPAQGSFVVTMSSVFDTYIEQYHISGPFLGVNDDLDTVTAPPESVVTDSRMAFIVPTGTYVLAASSFDSVVTGPYTLEVAPRTQTLTGCTHLGATPWITRGITITDQVEATDCVTMRPGGRAFGDRVLIVLTFSRTLSVTLESTAFTPRLELYQETAQGEVFRLAADGTGGVATLSYTPIGGPLSPPTVYRLEITSVDSVQTGAYTLTENSNPPLGSVTLLPNSPAGWRAADILARPAPAKPRAK